VALAGGVADDETSGPSAGIAGFGAQRLGEANASSDRFEPAWRKPLRRSPAVVGARPHLPRSGLFSVSCHPREIPTPDLRASWFRHSFLLPCRGVATTPAGTIGVSLVIQCLFPTDKQRGGIMARGFQAAPIQEYASLVGIANCVATWQRAERQTARIIRRDIAAGVRAQVIADHLGWSRSTLYRWLDATPDPD
jgi:hypothetical protein